MQGLEGNLRIACIYYKEERDKMNYLSFQLKNPKKNKIKLSPKKEDEN